MISVKLTRTSPDYCSFEQIFTDGACQSRQPHRCGASFHTIMQRQSAHPMAIHGLCLYFQAAQRMLHDSGRLNLR